MKEADSKRRKNGFVKLYINLNSFFDAQEIRLLTGLIHLEYLRSNGYATLCSREYMLMKFRMNIRVFQRCSKRFMELGLLCKNREGVYFDYSLNRALYERLLDILCCTSDLEELGQFCQSEFVEKGRSIESITDSEIGELTGRGSRHSVNRRW